jgi:hypothetical protein
VANYDVTSVPMRQHFPAALWAVHGQGIAGYPVIARALGDGSHVRVGFRGPIHLPDGRLARANAELVTWAVEGLGKWGRRPATSRKRVLITGCGSRLEGEIHRRSDPLVLVEGNSEPQVQLSGVPLALTCGFASRGGLPDGRPRPGHRLGRLRGQPKDPTADAIMGPGKGTDSP